MYRTTLVFAVLFIFISLTTFAQVTIKEYNSKKETLTLQKKELKKEIETLKSEIKSLRNRIPELEQKITTAFRELYDLKYGEEIGNNIAYKQIWIGMTDEMVLDSWGEPDRVDKNVESWGTFTQWYYGDVTFFFKDKKLTNWEGEEEKISN